MTLEELQEIKAGEELAKSQKKKSLHVCVAAGCMSQNADGVVKALQEKLREKNLEKEVEVKGVGCMGLCAAGPLVSVEPDTRMFQEISPANAHLVTDNLEKGKRTTNDLPSDSPFFTRQLKIVTENCGVINPEKIEEYIAADGYFGLYTVLHDMEPAEVVQNMIKSGLRGRGGGGYPTGLKWSTVSKAAGQKKYVICNADEGDPGAFMDRSVLESDPHRILEGMAIAAYAIGADEGFIYVRAEYPLAISRLKTAIKQAERKGLLGSTIFGTTFNFSVSIRLGAGAFVCGEETALIASIEGGRGTPRPRPPYPAESGLWGKPTLINNVETFANVAPIIRKGAEWYSSIGTESSKGTKVFALAGQVVNTGLIEVPMGMSLREIIFEIGGGIPGGRKFKAVQTGGPSGGCIPEEFLDIRVDYESLTKLGSIMGSGGMIVMDENSNMVDVARYFMEFCMSESCGKCVPCRVGTAQIYDLLTRFAEKQATESDLVLLEELCDVVKNTSLCGLGQSAPNPVLSTLKYFRHEYLERIQAEVI